MNRVFLSYAHEDEASAKQIERALRENGLDPWLDDIRLRTGDELLAVIANALQGADYFAVLLSPAALTKSWVITERRMALSREIDHGCPKVLVLWLRDCEMPVELQHKLYLDFRGRFEQATQELCDYIRGIDKTPEVPKQTILANMLRTAGPQLWKHFTAGPGSDEEWDQNEAAAMIQEVRARDLEAGVAVGNAWKGDKEWEMDLVHVVQNRLGISDALARRTVRSLADHGLILEADDLDYRREPEQAWYATSLLWILHRVARRSGLFPLLPPPLPEHLSALLAFERGVLMTGSGWYAVRYTRQVVTALDTSQTCMAAVIRYEPAQTWVFRTAEDREPLTSVQRYGITELTPASPFAPHGEIALAWFSLPEFDDLHVLRDG